jgi:hypothetical protein
MVNIVEDTTIDSPVDACIPGGGQQAALHDWLLT